MKCFGAVDLHDRYRQGFLNLEDSWKTKRCWLRVFTTILGICFTDAYLAYKLECEQINVHDEEDQEDVQRLSYYKFLGKLAYQMAHNDLDVEDQPPVLRSSVQLSSSPSLPTGSPSPRFLASFKKSGFIKEKIGRKFKKAEAIKEKLTRYQRRCNICRKAASFYCTECSNEPGGKFFTICTERSERECWFKHCQKAHS